MRANIHLLIILLNVHESSHPGTQPRSVHQLLSGCSSLNVLKLWPNKSLHHIISSNLKCPGMVNQIYVLRLFQGEVHRGLNHKVGVPILPLSLLIFDLSKGLNLGTCPLSDLSSIPAECWKHFQHQTVVSQACLEGWASRSAKRFVNC